MPTAFSKVDFNNYMNEDIMDSDLFESLAQYPSAIPKSVLWLYI